MAILYVIYVRDTTDERIFHGVDWSEELGSNSVESIHWYTDVEGGGPAGRWEDQEGRLPEAPEEWGDEAVPDFDVALLSPGDEYPGRYAGAEYHVDAKGRPFKRSRMGRRTIASEEVHAAAALVLKLKRGGKFVISPEGHMMTRVGGDLVFLGVLSDALEFETAPESHSRIAADPPPTFGELFGDG